MSEQEKELSVLRNEIDAIDQQIQRLLNQRAECVHKVADVKHRYEPNGTPVFYRPEREAQVMRRVIERNDGGAMPSHLAAHLIREVMSVCLSLEKTMRVMYIDESHGAPYQAARKHFGSASELIEAESLAQAFSELAQAKVDYILVPFVVGSELNDETLSLLLGSNSYICGEVSVPVAKDQIFLIVGNQQVSASGDDRTWFYVSDANADADSVFEQLAIEPNAIWSVINDVENGWCIDVNGHTDEQLKPLMEQLTAQFGRVRTLGAYPKAVL